MIAGVSDGLPAAGVPDATSRRGGSKTAPLQRRIQQPQPGDLVDLGQRAAPLVVARHAPPSTCKNDV